MSAIFYHYSWSSALSLGLRYDTVCFARIYWSVYSVKNLKLPIIPVNK